jgi:hypothetical protein
MCCVTVVFDLSICCAVELNYRDVVSARSADWLDRRVDWLDRPRITGREIRVHRSRIASKYCDLHTEHRIARHDVHKASSITVSNGEYSSRVDAISLREISNQILDKSNIIDVRICATRGPGWIRLIPCSVSVYIYRDTKGIQRRLTESGLRLDTSCIVTVSMKAKNERRSFVRVVVLRNMNRVIPEETITWIVEIDQD